MPCCTETIGAAACMDMQSKHPVSFKNRCQNDPDFAIVQCCKTCNTDVAALGKELFAYGTKSKHCFDRHNKKFCLQFLHQVSLLFKNYSISNLKNYDHFLDICNNYFRSECGQETTKNTYLAMENPLLLPSESVAELAVSVIPISTRKKTQLSVVLS